MLLDLGVILKIGQYCKRRAGWEFLSVPGNFGRPTLLPLIKQLQLASFVFQCGGGVPCRWVRVCVCSLEKVKWVVKHEQDGIEDELYLCGCIITWCCLMREGSLHLTPLS